MRTPQRNTQNNDVKKVPVNSSNINLKTPPSATGRSKSVIRTGAPVIHWSGRNLPEIKQNKVDINYRNLPVPQNQKNSVFLTTPYNRADINSIPKLPQTLQVDDFSGTKREFVVVPNDGGGVNSCFFMSISPYRFLSYLYRNKNIKGAEAWNDIKDPARTFIMNELGKVLTTPTADDTDPRINEVKSWAICAIEQDVGSLNVNQLTPAKQNEWDKLELNRKVLEINMRDYIAQLNQYELSNELMIDLSYLVLQDFCNQHPELWRDSHIQDF